MKIDDLLGRLKAGKIPAVVVLHGTESWFVDQAVRSVVKGFLDGDPGGVVTLDAPRAAGDSEGTPLSEALDEARTRPMFSGRKVVLFRVPRALEEAEVTGIHGVARAELDFSRLIVFSRSLGKGAEKVLTKGGAAVAEVKPPYENPWPGSPEWKTGLNRWVVGQARERGKRISPQDALSLTRIVGNDLGALSAALDRLVLSSGDRPQITEDEIRTLTGRERGHDAFAFGEAIYARDAVKALAVARNAFLDGVADRWGKKTRNSDAVAGRLLWSARHRLNGVYEAAMLLAGGKSEDEVIQALGGRKNPGALRSAEQAGAFPVDALRRHYVLLTAAEGELRSATPAQAVITRLVLELAGSSHA